MDVLESVSFVCPPPPSLLYGVLNYSGFTYRGLTNIKVSLSLVV